MRLSLRAKLTLWSLAIFALIHVAVTLGWSYLRADQGTDLLDQRLEQLARRAELSLREPATRPWTTDELESQINGAVRDRFVERYLLQIRTTAGVLERASREAQELNLPVPTAAAQASGAPLFETIEVGFPGGQRTSLRVLTLPFRTSSERDYLMQVAALSPYSGDLVLAMNDFLEISLPVSLLAAALASWLLAGTAVAPLRRVAQAARAVGSHESQTRIDVAPADTETAKLQSALNDALGRLEASYRAQEAFLSNASHELKTPVSILLLEAQTLRASAPLNADLARFASSVEAEMRRMSRLLESLLLIARVDSGKALLRDQAVHLNDLLLEAVEHCASLALQHEVQLSTRLPDTGPEALLAGDPDLLRTMLENLIRNALRFSPRQGLVEVELCLREGQAEFSVADRGPGLPPEVLSGLFRRFAQGPRESRRGSGLGLAIAQSVAELHQGSIQARARSGGGTLFVVRLPLST